MFCATAAPSRLLPQQRPADEQTSDLALQLLDLMAPDLADQRVTRVMDGSRLSQLIVVLSRLNPAPPKNLLDPLIRELLRNRGNKLPQHTPGMGEISYAISCTVQLVIMSCCEVAFRAVAGSNLELVLCFTVLIIWHALL